MKKSNYNIILYKENASLIYNSFTNSYLALSNKACQSFEFMSTEEFGKLYAHIYKKMYEIGIIIPEAMDELAIIRYKNKVATFGSRKLRIVVYPTQDCNLKCWYCYESHIPNTKMRPSTIERIVKYVTNSIKSNTFDEFYITMFGGEPFTDFDTIAYPLLDRVKKIVEKSGKKFTCFFVTNATLINSSIIQKLKSLHPHFQITIDGNKEQHNRIRVWKNGDKPTFNHILWVIHKLCKEIEGDNFFLTLRINYDNKTLCSLLDILEQINDLDRKKVYIHFERIWQTEKESTQEYKRLLKDILKKYIEAGFCVNQGTFRGFPYSCPSDINNSIVINYDGSIHMCNGRTLSKKTQYGSLLEDGTLDIDQNLMAKRLAKATFEHKECLKCKMLPVCMGPCSQKLLENEGKWSKEICSMGSIDSNLTDFLLMDFWVKSMIEKYNE